jgi:AcrR family transcriptional regulator
MPTPRAGHPRRIDPDEVVRLAIAIVDAEGLAAVTMRRLASEIGVTAMSLYRHFADKDALLMAVGEQIGSEIEVRRAGAPMAPDADVFDRLRALLRPPIEVLLGHHHDITALLQSQNVAQLPGAFPAEVVEAHEESLRLLAELGISGGEAAQWVYLIRETVFMLAAACRPIAGPVAAGEVGNHRVVAHWQGAPLAGDDAQHPLTDRVRSSIDGLGAEVSILDRGIEMVVYAVRDRAGGLRHPSAR